MFTMGKKNYKYVQERVQQGHMTLQSTCIHLTNQHAPHLHIYARYEIRLLHAAGGVQIELLRVPTRQRDRVSAQLSELSCLPSEELAGVYRVSLGFQEQGMGMGSGVGFCRPAERPVQNSGDGNRASSSPSCLLSDPASKAPSASRANCWGSVPSSGPTPNPAPEPSFSLLPRETCGCVSTRPSVHEDVF